VLQIYEIRINERLKLNQEIMNQNATRVDLCRTILLRLGVEEKSLVLGTVNAGHPGGMIPLTPRDAASLHPARLPDNLFVSDASLLPRALGNPPILTVMALAKAIGKRIKEAAA
jgi:hypothetical protein